MKYSNNITVLLFCLSFFSMRTVAQKEGLHGRILDGVTKAPLAAASIYYKDSPIGVISNENGEFLLEKADYHTVVVSYLGYESVEYSVTDMPENIYMKSGSIHLPELVVIPIHTGQLVKKIRNRYHKIYTMEKAQKRKPLFSFFYRQTTMSDTIYNEFTECFFTGDNTYGVNELKLQKGRYAKTLPDSTMPFAFTFTNFFSLLQLRPFYHKNPPKKVYNTFIQPNSEKLFDIEIDQIIHSKTQGDVVVLRFTPKKNTNIQYTLFGKLYVMLDDLSIIRFEGTIPNVGTSNPMVKCSSAHFIVNYKQNVKSYPIVESISCNAKLDVVYNRKKHNVEIKAMLFDCSYQFSLKSGKKLSYKDDLIQSINKIDSSPEFWRNNPIIKRTANEEAIIRSFQNKKVFGNFQP